MHSKFLRFVLKVIAETFLNTSSLLLIGFIGREKKGKKKQPKAIPKLCGPTFSQYM